MFQTKQRKRTPKVRKPELSFLYKTRHLVLFYISTKIFPRVFKLDIIIQSKQALQCQKVGKIVKSWDYAEEKVGLVSQIYKEFAVFSINDNEDFTIWLHSGQNDTMRETRTCRKQYTPLKLCYATLYKYFESITTHQN